MPKSTHYPQQPQRHHSVVAKKILLALSVPLVVAATPLTTQTRWTRDFYNGLEGLEELLFPKDEKIDEKKIRRSLYSLKDRGYINYRYSRDKKKAHFSLTKKGQALVRGYTIDGISISKKQRWDGRWRFVMFDVPERQRETRDFFRSKLTSMNFFQVQKSVWVFPYACEKEIDLLAEYLHAQPYILIFTGAVNKEAVLKRHFQKLGFLL